MKAMSAKQHDKFLSSHGANESATKCARLAAQLRRRSSKATAHPAYRHVCGQHQLLTKHTNFSWTSAGRWLRKFR